jgi:glycerophosphoryl diester phosphodiesterase
MELMNKMKKIILNILLIILVLFVVGCDEPTPPDDPDGPGTTENPGEDEGVKLLSFSQAQSIEELQKLNFGYYFTDKEGNRPYKDLTHEEVIERGLQILEVEDLFKEFYETNKDLLFIVEIKNSGERGYEACDKLASALNKYPEYKDQIVIGTFNPEIETYLKETYPSLHRGASTAGAAGFVITEMLKVNLFNTNKFSCLQVPMSYDIKGIEIKLDSKMYINRAHRRNIAVQYWTINDKEEMKYLTDLGCDAIMTDDLDAAKEFIEEYYN